MGRGEYHTGVELRTTDLTGSWPRTLPGTADPLSWRRSHGPGVGPGLVGDVEVASRVVGCGGGQVAGLVAVVELEGGGGGARGEGGSEPGAGDRGGEEGEVGASEVESGGGAAVEEAEQGGS